MENGVGMESCHLYAFSNAPELKLIKLFNENRSGYVEAKAVSNTNSKVEATANNIVLPEPELKSYGEYTIGLDNSFSEKLNGFVQINLRSGKREGWGGMFGLKYVFGKQPLNSLYKEQNLNGNKEVKL